jgi:hypothetical protein
MLRGTPASSPQRRRRAELATFTAPVAGWISNRALAIPKEDGMPQGAQRLDNFFPTATGCVLRRGSTKYVQISNSGQRVLSLFKYIVGENIRMFGATDDTIYDITTVAYPENFSLSVDQGDDLLIDDEDNTIGENSGESLKIYENTIGGDWVTVQFGITGGTYLIGVNGSSTAFVFDGTNFYPYDGSDVLTLAYDAQTLPFVAGGTITGGTSGATAKIYKVVPSVIPNEGVLWLTDKAGGPFVNNELITGSGGSALTNGTATTVATALTFPSDYAGLTTADLSFVWIYKEALFFIEKNNLRAWYLEPDMIGGELKPYPLNGFFDKGGSLLWGQSWSLASSDAGGLSSQNVFTTTEGESAVFQGINPSDATWAQVGVYSVGKPLGKHGFIRAGGDIVIATDVGDIALSKAVQVDYSVLAPNAVSYPINVDWNDAISQRGRDWHCEIWPEGQMAIVIPPNTDSADPIWFVSNANTGAWAPFTNWRAHCVLSWNGRLFYGSDNGYVFEAMVGGTDNGDPYTGVYVPLFSDVGKPTANKTARMARIETKSRAPISEKVSCLFDFNNAVPSPPDSTLVPVGNEWDNAIWNSSLWDASRSAVITTRRHSVAGNGYRMAPVFQVTSGAVVPLDVEIITLDVTFESGDAFT